MTDAERIAVLETQQAALGAAVVRMEAKIDQLTEAAARGRGAVAVLLALGGSVGSVLGWLAGHINFH